MASGAVDNRAQDTIPDTILPHKNSCFRRSVPM
jgi:hypothetical protein